MYIHFTSIQTSILIYVQQSIESCLSLCLNAIQALNDPYKQILPHHHLMGTRLALYNTITTTNETHTHKHHH